MASNSPASTVLKVMQTLGRIPTPMLTRGAPNNDLTQAEQLASGLMHTVATPLHVDAPSQDCATTVCAQENYCAAMVRPLQHPSHSTPESRLTTTPSPAHHRATKPRRHG